MSLTDFISISKNSNIGLIGVYEEANDTREGAVHKRRFLDVLIDLFIKLRHSKPVELKLKENIKHIYVMNSTFINKKKALDIGGLDDIYYPSSDFAFSAKMAFHYNTYFLPIKLVDKGLGDSLSLEQKICDDSIKCAYNQTFAMCKTLGYSDKKAKRKASYAAVVSEIGLRGYNNVDYGKVKEKLKMKKIYNNKLIILLINLHSKISWGLLLFRRTK